jgi:aarF domain-containing kinase
MFSRIRFKNSFYQFKNLKIPEKNRIVSKRGLSNNSTVTPTINYSKSKKFLIFTSVSAGVYLGYYSLVLDKPGKRRALVYCNSILRAGRSFYAGAKTAIDYKWSLRGLDDSTDEYNEAIKGCHQRAADRMLSTCLSNAGLYIKMGQAVSTMNHILPKEFYTTLRVLQTQALRSDGANIDELFQEEFQIDNPLELFEEFDYKPIAAASLAQVHKAKTKDGDEVAVKLQYIDLLDRFPVDILTLRTILAMVGFAFPSFNMSWVLDDLKGNLEKELDFLNEAENSRRCMRELKHLDYVYVPKVFDQYSTKKVLTMEFINAHKISDIDAIKKDGLSIKEIDENLINMFSEQIFHSGFVHADPHHGNILVRKLSPNSKSN